MPSGVRTRETRVFYKHGKPIWSEPRGIEDRLQRPRNFDFHRGTLQQIMLDAAIRTAGGRKHYTAISLPTWSEEGEQVWSAGDFIDKATATGGSYERRDMDRVPTASLRDPRKAYPQEGPADLERTNYLARHITPADQRSLRRTMIMGRPTKIEMCFFFFSSLSDSNQPDASQILRSTGGREAMRRLQCGGRITPHGQDWRNSLARPHFG